MKNKIIKKLIAATAALAVAFPVCGVVNTRTVSAADTGLLPAFPGAEGAGMYATGGRGGEVYHVTNLNDSGSGSFRDAVSKGPRIVVFDVGGTITLKSDVIVKNNVTILGQTAPGGAGITLSGGKLGQGGSNQIIRFISSRPGERGGGEYDAWGGNNGSNSIVDHCSIGWGNDEQWGLYSNNTNQTVQYSIIGPSNCVSTHAKGLHGFGIMFGRGQNSWHHNMIAHNISRNFRGKVVGTEAMDFVNNVMYDWGYQTAYGTFGHLNYVGNYLKAGNGTTGSYHFMVRSSGSGLDNYKFYVAGNRIVKKNGTSYNSSIDSNNWNGVGFDRNRFGSDIPFPVKDVNGNDVSVAYNPQTADEAFETVLAYAGAGIDAQSRPRIDREVMEEARTGTGNLTGACVDTVTDSEQKSAISRYHIKQINYEEYYPETIKKTITDTDNDGMPDDWEIARGLNPKNAADASGDYLGQGYMNIEYYANDLTVNAFPEGVIEQSPTTQDLGDEYFYAKEDIGGLSISPTKIKTAGDLILPQTAGTHGTSIVWQSSSSSVKIKNNLIDSVKRADSDKKVTLTASAMINGYNINKSFDITVVGSSVFWKPSANVKQGDKLMNGLTAQFDGTYKAAELKTNGVSFAGYLTGSAGGGKLTDGKVTGTSFKFVAPADGYLDVYVTRLGAAPTAEKPEGNLKTLYITPEGAGSNNDNIAAVGGRGINTWCTAEVEKGKTYYIYVAGSNGCFNGIKFSENAPKTQIKAVPMLWNFGSEPFVTDNVPSDSYFQEGATEGRYDVDSNSIAPENFGGLKFTVDTTIENAYTGAKKVYDDGFESTWQIKMNGGGSADNKVFSFYPAYNGEVTVYARSGSGSNPTTVTIEQGGVEKSREFVATGDEGSILPTISMLITGGTEVKIYASGNTGYSAIKYYSEDYTPPMPEPSVSPSTPPFVDYLITTYSGLNFEKVQNIFYYGNSLESVLGKSDIDGYDFLGWYTNPEFTGEPVDLSKTAIELNAFTFYARYAPSDIPINPGGVFYKQTPVLSGKTVTAAVTNYTDDSGVLFIAAAYEGEVLAEVITVTVSKTTQDASPHGEPPATEISREFSREYTNVRFYLWSQGTLMPYSDVKQSE